MKIIFGADDTSPTVEAVQRSLRERGHEVKNVPEGMWPDVALTVGEAVGSGEAEMGVLMCWTGTGTSMTANKVPGVRAALCWDPWIAEGARKWNDANVLVMSLKRVSPGEAVRILDAWFSIEGPDLDELKNIEKLSDLDRRR